jgi:hypothetical protein
VPKREIKKIMKKHGKAWKKMKKVTYNPRCTPIANAVTEGARLFNRQHKAAMARHENVNKRIKQFNVLRSWRHKDDEKHKLCFGAILNLTQISLHFQPLPELCLPDS